MMHKQKDSFTCILCCFEVGSTVQNYLYTLETVCYLMSSVLYYSTFVQIENFCCLHFGSEHETFIWFKKAVNDLVSNATLLTYKSFLLLTSTDRHICNSFSVWTPLGWIKLSSCPAYFSWLGWFQVIPILVCQRYPQSCYCSSL
jgi:hypothetical protein